MTEQRMKNPALILPDAMQAIQGLIKTINTSGAPASVLALSHLRASQINGCSACVEGGIKHAKFAGETDERLHAVATWRESKQFTEAERAALALAEAATRLADREEPVSDEVWNNAVKHFEEPALAALVLHIAVTNLFNRLNVTTRQEPGQW